MVNATWVRVDGRQLLSIALPHNQFVTVDHQTAYALLFALRAAVRSKPPPTGDNGATSD